MSTKRISSIEAKSLLAPPLARESEVLPRAAFLLAGGLAERLRPLSDRIPKCLAPIGDVPLLEIWLDLCRQHGVRRALINVSRHADQVADFLQRQTADIDVRLVRENEPLGNAGTVRANRAFVSGEESFYILYTDNLTDASLTRLAMCHRGHQGPLTMGLFHTSAPRASGIVQMGQDGLITGFEEKPESPQGTLANAGIYVARQSLFDVIPEGPIVDFGRHVFPTLVGRMYGSVIEDYLLDIGNPAALALASKQWADRKRGLVSREG
jgi:mannose-1-phosphate guanylyltransferase